MPNECVCHVDYTGPDVRCNYGHEYDLRRLTVPAWYAVVDTKCPLVVDGDRCDASMSEIECWHTPAVIEEMRAEARGGSL